MHFKSYRLSPTAFSLMILLAGLWMRPEIQAMPAPTLLELVPTLLLQQSDEEAWQVASSANTEAAYRAYTRQFPNGQHVLEAAKNIALLRDNADWEVAREGNTLASYQKYLDNHPDGLYKSQAQRMVNRFSPTSSRTSDVAVTNPAPRNNTTSPPANPDPAPVSPPVTPKSNTPTTNAATGDEEESTWNEIQSLGTADAFKLYLNQYPDGKYAQEALENIPMEISYSRDKMRDSIFFIEIKYGKAPVSLASAELTASGNTFTPGGGEDLSGGLMPPTDPSLFYWPEGKLNGSFTQIQPGVTNVEVSLGLPQTYLLRFKDANEQTQQITIEGGMADLTLKGVNGRTPEEDTLYMIITGGTPPYYARFLNPGDELDEYICEVELTKYPEENAWYLAKGKLIAEQQIEGGSFNLYIMDNRKTEYEEYNYDIFFKGGSQFQFKTFLLLGGLFVGLFIAYMILRRLIRKNKAPRYGYKGYR